MLLLITGAATWLHGKINECCGSSVYLHSFDFIVCWQGQCRYPTLSHLLDDIMAIYAGTQFSCITMMNFHAEEDSTFENRVLYDTCLYIYIKTVNSVKPAPWCFNWIWCRIVSWTFWQIKKNYIKYKCVQITGRGDHSDDVEVSQTHINFRYQIW